MSKVKETLKKAIIDESKEILEKLTDDQKSDFEVLIDDLAILTIQIQGSSPRQQERIGRELAMVHAGLDQFSAIAGVQVYRFVVKIIGDVFAATVTSLLAV
jgi:hypothetical protein